MPEPRFLIARLSALGDCLHTVPLACALRRQYPEAFIAWVVEEPAAPLLAGHAAIDELVVVRRKWLKSVTRTLDVRQRLQALGCTVSIDPQGLIKSSMAAWLSGATRRLGFARPQGRELSPWLNNERIAATQPHMIERYLELLAPLGVAEPRVEFNLPAYPQARAAVEPFLRAAHLGCPFAVINVGAGWNSKLWPCDRFARVAKHLGQRCQMPSVVTWAGERERALAESVVAAAGGFAILAPRTSLPELAELLRKAAMCVSSDTGPLHLAAALGTPCVGLFGPTLPHECGPYGAQHVAVQAWHQAGSCRERRAAENTAMRDITADDVIAACERQLQSLAARVA